jgi:hypothetical protein
MPTKNVLEYFIKSFNVKGPPYDFTGLFQVLSFTLVIQGLKYSSPYKLTVRLSAKPSTVIYLVTDTSFKKFHFAL